MSLIDRLSYSIATVLLSSVHHSLFQVISLAWKGILVLWSVFLAWEIKDIHKNVSVLTWTPSVSHNVSRFSTMNPSSSACRSTTVSGSSACCAAYLRAFAVSLAAIVCVPVVFLLANGTGTPIGTTIIVIA